MSSVQHITRTGQFQAVVDEVSSLSPRMRRIVLRADDVSERTWPLGCDVAIVLQGEDGREVRRRYTVRSVLGDAVVIDAVLHGHGPGSAWAAGVAAGDRVHFFGPRGQVDLPEADWRLALTDESGLPAVAAVAEALGGQPLTVFAEVATESERYPMPANADVTLLPRGDAPPGSARLLGDAIVDLPPRSGRGFGYVLGESRAVVTLRDALQSVGLGRADVYAKGYWNTNARAGR